MPPQTPAGAPPPAAPAPTLAPTSSSPQAPQSLAERIRAKYPGAYDDLDDVTLESRVKAKFPGAYDDIPTAAEVSPEGFLRGSVRVPVPEGGANQPPSRPSLLTQPTTDAPALRRADYPTGKTGIFGDVILPAAMEIGGAMFGAGRVAPAARAVRQAVSATSAVPRLAQHALPHAVTSGGAGAGAATGHVVGQTLAREGPPPAPTDLARSTALTGALAAGGESAVPAIAAVGRKTLAPFAGKITESGRRAYDYLRGHVTPGQVSESRFLNLIDNIMEGSIFGGSRRRQFIQQQAQQLDESVQKILAEHLPAGRTEAATMSEAGKTWQRLQAAARSAERDIGKQLYQQVDDLAEVTSGAKVSLTALVEFAEAESARRGALGLGLRGGAGPRALKQVQAAGAAGDADTSAAREAASWLRGAEPGSTAMTPEFLEALNAAGVGLDAVEAGLTFSQAREVRSALGAMIDKAKRSTDPNADTTKRIATGLKTRIDQALTDAAGGPDTPLRKALDAANAQWFKVKETFDRGILREVAQKKPRVVVHTLIRPHEVDDILKARQAVGDKGWREVEGTFAAHLFRKKGDEIVTGDQLMQRLGAYGKETLDAAFPRGTADGIWQFARVLTQLQQKREGVGKVAITLMQGGAAIGLVTATGRAQDAATLLLTPVLLSHAVLSPVGRRWLTVGLKAPPGSREAVQAGTQLLAWLTKQGLLSLSGPPQGGEIRAVDQVGGRGAGPGPRTGQGGAPAGMAPVSASTPPPNPPQ